MKTDTITEIKSALDAIWQKGDIMVQKELQVGDELEFNGKTYKVVPEVRTATCKGCAFKDAPLCLSESSNCIADGFIFEEVKDVPRRHIELGVVKVEGDKVTFKIIAQTHRNEDFCQQTELDIFEASNKIVLKSRNTPEWRDDESTLFCRGYILSKDNIEIVCTTSEFSRISEAINEYNITDGKGYEKPWPCDGDRYFYIASYGNVVCEEFRDGSFFDTNCKAYGNFFRTREEAEAAANKIKALFKEISGRKK